MFNCPYCFNWNDNHISNQLEFSLITRPLLTFYNDLNQIINALSFFCLEIYVTWPYRFGRKYLILISNFQWLYLLQYVFVFSLNFILILINLLLLYLFRYTGQSDVMALFCLAFTANLNQPAYMTSWMRHYINKQKYYANKSNHFIIIFY